MRINLYKILVVLSVTYLIVMYFLGKGAKNDVLGTTAEIHNTPISTVIQTPTPTESPAPTQSPTPIPTKTPAPTPKPTATPAGASSSEINGFIERFSAQYGVDANVLRYIAICESGFRSNAKNGPYIGLYQFGEITWENIRREFGEDTNPDLRYSAEESVQTAAYALSKGKSGIWPNCQP